MTITNFLPTPVVRVSTTGNAFTTSTDVAAFFDKCHSHVLRAIEGLIGDLAEHADALREGGQLDEREGDEHQPNFGLMFPEQLFEPSEVEVVVGQGGVRRDPIYNLSRDGFALLAMSFTGKQALAFKLAYIAAFNTMEAKLRQPYVVPLIEDLEFAKGVRMKDKIMLHDQAYKASRALSNALNDEERRQAYWQLYQINTTLGIPMPSMSALGVVPLHNATLPLSSEPAGLGTDVARTRY